MTDRIAARRKVALVEAKAKIMKRAIQLSLMQDTWGSDAIEGLTCHYDPNHDRFQCQGWVSGLRLMCWVDGK